MAFGLRCARGAIHSDAEGGKEDERLAGQGGDGLLDSRCVHGLWSVLLNGNLRNVCVM